MYRSLKVLPPVSRSPLFPLSAAPLQQPACAINHPLFPPHPSFPRIATEKTGAWYSHGSTRPPKAWRNLPRVFMATGRMVDGCVLQSVRDIEHGFARKHFLLERSGIMIAQGKK